jgi:hypothetical protein
MKNRPNEKHSIHPSNFNQEPVYYEIMVQGELSQVWTQWFEGMALTYIEDRENGVSYTLISGTVVDQSALFGLLIKIQNLNLTLISVRRFTPGMNMDTGSA